MIEFLRKIVTVLDSQNIPYMLSGSVAMGLYIVPRFTKDFDFIVHLKPDDVSQELQRPQQMEDIKQLTAYASLDWNYINGWLKDLNLKTFDLIKND